MCAIYKLQACKLQCGNSQKHFCKLAMADAANQNGVNFEQVRPSSGTAVYPHMPTYVHAPRDISRTAHL